MALLLSLSSRPTAFYPPPPSTRALLSLHVGLCVSCPCVAPPVHFCSALTGALEVISFSLRPCQGLLQLLFFACEGGRPWSLLCSLSRTTSTSSSRPVANLDLRRHSSFTPEISKTCPREQQSSKLKHWGKKLLTILSCTIKWDQYVTSTIKWNSA